MILSRLFCLVLPIWLWATATASAEIIMPVTFCDGMVLQREMPVRVFGQAGLPASPFAAKLAGEYGKN